LILDLLHLSRVESGKASFEIQEVDLHETCRQCAQFLAEEAHRRDVQLVVVPPPAPVRIQSDPNAIRTIVENLMVNAIRYTPAQGQVRIRCQRARGWATLEVKDTGIGIAPEHHERVFERFYRVDKARSRDVGGTGLGLSIVKHLAQSFGGGVELESELGRGSTFRVRIPSGEKGAAAG
jgi:two-component system phosphate regulon sensor histidine kinase PhoR